MQRPKRRTPVRTLDTFIVIATTMSIFAPSDSDSPDSSGAALTTRLALFRRSGPTKSLPALNENLDKRAFYAAFWKATNWVLVAAKRCAFSSR